MFAIVNRYFFGNDNDGLIGKLQQHRGTFKRSTEGFPDAKEIISGKVLDLLDGTPVIRHCGSIGAIYVGRYKGHDIALKVVLDSTRSNIDTDMAGLNFVGIMGRMMNNRTNEIVSELSRNVVMELDMRREWSWCKRIKNELPLAKYGMRVLHPVRKLCKISDGTCFAYVYDSAIPLETISLDASKINDICHRICLFFFHSMHNVERPVILGDINIGNFLYDQDSDEIVLIDYGCVSYGTDEGMARMRQLHSSLQSLDLVREVVAEWRGPDALAQHIYAQSRAFFQTHSIDYEKDVPSTTTLLKDPRVCKFDMPPEITMAVRACSQLVDILRFFNADIDISDKFIPWLQNQRFESISSKTLQSSPAGPC